VSPTTPLRPVVSAIRTLAVADRLLAFVMPCVAMRASDSAYAESLSLRETAWQALDHGQLHRDVSARIEVSTCDESLQCLERIFRSHDDQYVVGLNPGVR